MQDSPGVNVTKTTTTALFPLNTLAWMSGGKAYTYVLFSTGGVTGDGYVCSITNAGTAIMADTDVAASILQGNRVGVADMAAAAADYGWLQVYGPCGVRTEQDAAANLKQGPTADAGQIDDAAATGIFINGIHLQTATGGVDAVNSTAFIKWPTFEIQMEPET